MEKIKPFVEENDEFGFDDETHTLDFFGFKEIQHQDHYQKMSNRADH